MTPAKITLTPLPGVPGSHQALVELRVQDAAGGNVERPFALLVYLSDDPRGIGLTASPPSDEIHAHRPDGGTDLHVRCRKRAVEALTDGAGKYVLSANDTAHRGYFVCAVCPGTGEVHVSEQLTAANYGG